MYSVSGYKVAVGLLAIGAVYLVIAVVQWAFNPVNWHWISKGIFIILSIIWVWMISTSEMEPRPELPKKKAPRKKELY
jgi:hypothetical protein